MPQAVYVYTMCMYTVYIYIYTCMYAYIYIYIYTHMYTHWKHGGEIKALLKRSFFLTKPLILGLHPVSITIFPSFRTQTLDNLSHYLWKNRFLSNPDPGENLVSGNLVMETVEHDMLLWLLALEDQASC